jgi:hypothetical protein
MLLGELQVAAGGMDVGATPRGIELGQSAARMVGNLVVHGTVFAAIVTQAH